MTVVRDLRAWLPGVEGVLLCEFHLQWYWSALLGGLTFGVGAAFNEDCSLSTLQRLADSELSMLVTADGNRRRTSTASLASIPTLSVQAAVAYVALLAGIAIPC